MLRRRRRRSKIKDQKSKIAGGWDPDDFEDVRIDQIEEGDEILSLNEATGQFEPAVVKKLMHKGVQTVWKLTTASGRTIRTTSEHPYLVLTTKKSAFGADFQGSANSSINKPGSTRKGIITGYQKLSRRAWTAGESSPSNLGVDPDLEPFAAHAMNTVTNKPLRLQEEPPVWIKVKHLKAGERIAVAAQDGQLAFEKIVSIEKLGAREEVFDIEIEGTHNFVGNGIVAHNTTAPRPGLAARSQNVEEARLDELLPRTVWSKQQTTKEALSNTFMEDCVAIGPFARPVYAVEGGEPTGGCPIWLMSPWRLTRKAWEEKWIQRGVIGAAAFDVLMRLYLRFSPYWGGATTLPPYEALPPAVTIGKTCDRGLK